VLRPLADGAAVVAVEAEDLDTLRDVVRARYPALAERVYEPDGAFREFVNVFVDGEDARYLEAAAPLREQSEVVLLPAVSGG
jgi:molybdopterin synthase sulfur carrier subunit